MARNLATGFACPHPMGWRRPQVIGRLLDAHGNTALFVLLAVRSSTAVTDETIWVVDYLYQKQIKPCLKTYISSQIGSFITVDYLRDAAP